MFIDNFERFGVTADCKKVLPGMVYVDLQETKSRKEIYEAYKNGASIIFTSQNITDPELPVIKVNDVYETMLLMLNKHFHSPQDKVKLIAISGSNDKDIVLDLLHKMLGYKYSNLDYDSARDFENYIRSLKNITIEDMYEYLNKLASYDDHIMPIVIDYKLKYFKFINSFKFDCAIITGVESSELRDQNYVLASIRSFISQIHDSRPIIVNIDDDTVLKALEASRNTIVITFGLNKKAAVTATSIDVNQQTTFNYCLQRSFTTNSGIVQEPFEMPITINMLGSRSIYNALAAITCALYYDIDIEHIKSVLKNYAPPKRRFEISVFNGVTVLDNYCSCPSELDKTLEVIPMLSYSKLKLLISVNKNEDWLDGSDIVKILKQWSSMLGIDEVVLCGCLDINEQITPLSINDVRKLKKAAKGSMNIRYFDKLKDALVYLTADLNEGDLAVLAGSDEMNSGKELLKHMLYKDSKRVLH